MADNILKILVCGDVEGCYEQLFKRIQKILKKDESFSMLLCVGEFFGANEDDFRPYKIGAIKVPIPTYILGPLQNETKKYFEDNKGGDLAENIFYLGTSGIYTCSNGLKIAYLSGKEALDAPPSILNFTYKDVKSIESATGKKPQIDILLSSQWPSDVCNYAVLPEGMIEEKEVSTLVAYLASTIKPRYHFTSSLESFFERLPFRNHEVLKQPAQPVTRFISLAKVNNCKKQKWLYAFNICPSTRMKPEELCNQPSDVTENPYFNRKASFLQHLPNQGGQEKKRQFFYDVSDEDPQRNEKHLRTSGQKEKPPRKPSGPCWFCLSSSEVENHLVVSVGNYCYLALAKGGIVPFHLLILPIEHFQSTVELEEECLAEIGQFKASLKKMFHTRRQKIVCFERNYKSQHLQIQVVPIPEVLLPSLKETFLDLGDSSGYQLDALPQHSVLSQVITRGKPFFYVELPDGTNLFHRIHKHFDLQFGRKVLASPPLLNMSDRVDWRECKGAESEERSQRDEVKTFYRPFDFTLDDDDDSD